MASGRFNELKAELTLACHKAGRKPEEVRLVTVSKLVPEDKILEVYQAGQRVFGENRVQDLLKKMPVLPADIEWHLIGTLQRNKVKDVVDKVALIHSVDSLPLAAAISKWAVRKNTVANILLQVNIAEEASKHGFAKEELLNNIFAIAKLPALQVKGLMTIAPLAADTQTVRGIFAELRELAKQLAVLKLENIVMEELSMGMSEDFKIAVEEGATLIRIGSRIFKKPV